jgi:hypothetical protein
MDNTECLIGIVVILLLLYVNQKQPTPSGEVHLPHGKVMSAYKYQKQQRDSCSLILLFILLGAMATLFSKGK